MNTPKKEEKMKGKITTRNFPSLILSSRRGFTVVEVLVGSLIMLSIVMATLALYTKSNKVSVDQQQFSELQHDVRAAMYFVSRDIKSIGAGLPLQFSHSFLEGENNDQSGSPTIETDRLTVIGNSDPLRLIIDEFDHSAQTITVEPYQLDMYPYNANSYPDDPKGYVKRLIIILPNPDLNDQEAELGVITSVDFVANEIIFNRIEGVLPRELDLDAGGSESDYAGGTVHFVELRTYWLDVTGSYPSLQAGEDGYLGQSGVFYISQWNPLNDGYEHLALAQNIEDLQFQYHGDMDADQQLDDNNSDGVVNVNDFLSWDEQGDKNFNWNDDQVVAGIRSVRILILGKTANPFISFSGTPTREEDIRTYENIYGKPLIADSPEGAQPDKHRRFLLESTAQIRNMSLGIYNSGSM